MSIEAIKELARQWEAAAQISINDYKKFHPDMAGIPIMPVTKECIRLLVFQWVMEIEEAKAKP